MYRLIRAKFTYPRLLMLAVHLIFGLVALGHLSSFIFGYRHEKIKLREGCSFAFEDGFEVRLDKVHFVDDPAILEKPRNKLTGDEFHYRENFAETLLRRNGQEVRRGQVYLLRPMRFGNIQITLKRFTPPSSLDKTIKKDRQPGVVFVITGNPAMTIFMVAYPLMIAGIFIYLLMTWRISGRALLEKEV